MSRACRCRVRSCGSCAVIWVIRFPHRRLLGRIGDRFRAETRRFVRARGIPVLRLGSPNRSRSDDRAAGYWWELSMRQVETSRTLVLDDPRRARSFFEALVQDNIGIGRPEEVSMVFARQLRRPTQHRYQTRIFTTGTEIRIDFRY